MVITAHIRRERLLEAARGYLTLEMPDHALRELRAIDEPEHCSFDLHQLRGAALRQKEEFSEALIEFGKALAENPTDLTVLMGMAWCYKRTERLPLAIESMQQAYQSSPQEPVVLYNLACYFALSGDKTQALSWLGRSLRMEKSRLLRMEKSLRKLIADKTDGNTTQAFSWLGRPFWIESSLQKLIADESDFDGLRDDPDFQFVAESGKLSDAE